MGFFLTHGTWHAIYNHAPKVSLAISGLVTAAIIKKGYISSAVVLYCAYELAPAIRDYAIDVKTLFSNPSSKKKKTLTKAQEKIVRYTKQQALKYNIDLRKVHFTPRNADDAYCYPPRGSITLSTTFVNRHSQAIVRASIQHELGHLSGSKLTHSLTVVDNALYDCCQSIILCAIPSIIVQGIGAYFLPTNPFTHLAQSFASNLNPLSIDNDPWAQASWMVGLYVLHRYSYHLGKKMDEYRADCFVAENGSAKAFAKYLTGEAEKEMKYIKKMWPTDSLWQHFRDWLYLGHEHKQSLPFILKSIKSEHPPTCDRVTNMTDHIEYQKQQNRSRYNLRPRS